MLIFAMSHVARINWIARHRKQVKRHFNVVTDERAVPLSLFPNKIHVQSAYIHYDSLFLSVHSNLTSHPFILQLVTIVGFMRYCRVHLSVWIHHSCIIYTCMYTYYMHENMQCNKILSRNYFDTYIYINLKY